jgi:hypothetical protein
MVIQLHLAIAEIPSLFAFLVALAMAFNNFCKGERSASSFCLNGTTEKPDKILTITGKGIFSRSSTWKLLLPSP